MAAVLLRHRTSRDAGRLNHAEHSRRFQYETIKGPLEKSGGLAFWGSNDRFMVEDVSAALRDPDRHASSSCSVLFAWLRIKLGSNHQRTLFVIGLL
jgi:hypothetical protein